MSHRGLAVVFVVIAMGACYDTTEGKGNGDGPATTGGDSGGVPGDGGVLGAPGTVGQACQSDRGCRAGLVCTSGACAPGHASVDGTPCTISSECVAGEFCGPLRRCTNAGTGSDGTACQGDGDCISGLRCDLLGFSAACKPEGMRDVGATCASAGDCLGGLTCLSSACAPLPPSTNGIPPIAIPGWPGTDCPADDGPHQAYFRVPRGSNDGDFYRLPFPNDVRKKNGHLDLSNHPTPGSDLLGFDVVDRYLRYLEQAADGFSAYPTVFFRFSTDPDFNSLKASGALRFLDISMPQGVELGYGWTATTGRNSYICPDFMALRPPNGQALLPGHTYAVVLSGVVDTDLKPFKQPDDLAALLASATPGDAALAVAYPSYAPLRAWAAANHVDAASILNAAVFTIGHHEVPASKLVSAVAAATAPAATSWVKCGSAPSPCPQATGDRACGAADPNFDELHALVTLPVFQKGTEPYLTPTDGGDVELMGDGTPKVQKTEPVCMALTVPKGTMPAGGWPLVIYAHGTGGSFRSHVSEGVAARLASVDDGAGGKVQMAVLGIDQVAHGTRRGASTDSPSGLFYNFANPAAARGNPLQGAADQIALVRFAKGLDLPDAMSPTGQEIKFGAVAFWGHSQGATVGATAMSYATGVTGAALTGAGASLIDALLGKKNPIDVGDALPFILEDANVDINHPVLSLIQNAIDPADPLNHVGHIVAAPLDPQSAKHVFQAYGQHDTYTPPSSEVVLALAAGLQMASSPLSVTTPDDLGGLGPNPVPFGGNVTQGSVAYTAVVRQYAPSGYDGHYVSFMDPDGKKDVDHFLADAVSGKTPKIGR